MEQTHLSSRPACTGLMDEQRDASGGETLKARLEGKLGCQRCECEWE